jgi:hypothetical protein
MSTSLSGTVAAFKMQLTLSRAVPVPVPWPWANWLQSLCVIFLLEASKGSVWAGSIKTKKHSNIVLEEVIPGQQI